MVDSFRTESPLGASGSVPRRAKVHAAKALGISRRALYRLIAKHHLEGSRLENKAAGEVDMDR